MKWYKKVFAIILGFIVFLLLLNGGLNYWIKKELPLIINEQNDSPYKVVYKDLSISLLSRSITAKEIIVVPKSSLANKTTKAGVYAKVGSVKVNAFSIWDLVFSKKIRARSIVIQKPEVTFYKSDKKEKKPWTVKSDVVEPFSKVVYVSDIFLEEGKFTIADAGNSKPVASMNNISLQLEGILVSERTLQSKIPFEYCKYSVRADSLYYKVNEYYHIEANQFQTSAKHLDIAGLKLVPEYGRRRFLQVIPKEKDLYSLGTDTISLHGINWGFRNQDLFIHSTNLTVEKLNANVYRGKMPPDDLSEKKFFSKLLREMKFDLKIDTLRMRNSRIVYEEEKDVDDGSGKLVFGKFNLTATNIRSGYKQSKLKNVNINVKCRFMDVSPMRSDWTFNVMDKSDSFRIKGSILNFPAKNLAPFTKPYTNTILEGNLDEIYYDFNGDRNQSKGTFGINYDDFKVKIFRKNDRKKKNKILSAVVNLFVKNDSKEEVKKTEVEVNRIREKSFFNLLWLSIQEGLKKILL